MSFRLKAASAAALFLSAIAAVMATDAGYAGTAIEAPAASGAVSRSGTPVHYAPTREILQTLPGPSVSTEGSAAFEPQGADSAASSGSLDALVDSQQMPDAMSDEMRCLAGAVFFEAKSESLAGQLAVARVVINRRESGRFADSLCGVVYQPSQFSFVRGHSMPPIPTASRDWREAVAIAQIAMQESYRSPAEGALYFHARRVSPSWNRTRLAAIDNHIFYR